MMIAFVLGAAGLQLQSFRLLAALSWAAREASVAASSESLLSLQSLLAEDVRVIASSNRVTFELERVGGLICATGGVPVELFGQTSSHFLIEQRFCSREQARL